MAVTYTNTMKVARMTAVRDTIDAGAGNGSIQILTAADLLLAEFALDAVCGTVNGAGVLTFSNFPKSDTSANNSGTAAKAQIMDGNGVAQITGLTVGVGTGDVQLDSVNISVSQTVTLTSAVITHAV